MHANGSLQATVEDIARAAGVSVATVSRVLNSSPKVAAPTRQRVLDALDQLGYTPNNLARNLRARALPVFGLVIPDVRNPVYTALLRGVEDVALTRGFFVLLANTDEQPARESEYLRMLLAERVAGVILVRAAGTQLEPVQALLRMGIPVVALDRPLAELEIDTVQPDRARGVWLGIEHLASHGHTSIGLLNGPVDLTTARERGDAFQAVLRALDIPYRREWDVAADFREEGGFQAARTLLSRPDRPTALLVANNLMALGTLRAAAELHVRVPDDLAIVAFDETEWAPHVSPPLTTVAHDATELGRMAAELLERRVQDPSRSAVTVLLPPRLTVRRSCATRHHAAPDRKGDRPTCR